MNMTYLFIHSLSQEKYIEYLLCARQYVLGEMFQNSHFLHHVCLFVKCSFIHPNLEMGSILPITLQSKVYISLNRTTEKSIELFKSINIT